MFTSHEDSFSYKSHMSESYAFSLTLLTLTSSVTVCNNQIDIFESVYSTIVIAISLGHVTIVSYLGYGNSFPSGLPASILATKQC